LYAFYPFHFKLTEQMSIRRPIHAGSWYEDDSTTLKAELDGWLDAVPDELEQLGTLPIPGARIIIGPLVILLFYFHSPSFFFVSLKANETVTRAMRIQDHVLLGLTRLSTYPKRKLSH
jgi:hypothetical protein